MSAQHLPRETYVYPSRDVVLTYISRDISPHYILPRFSALVRGPRKWGKRLAINVFPHLIILLFWSRFPRKKMISHLSYEVLRISITLFHPSHYNFLAPYTKYHRIHEMKGFTQMFSLFFWDCIFFIIWLYTILVWRVGQVTKLCLRGFKRVSSLHTTLLNHKD